MVNMKVFVFIVAFAMILGGCTQEAALDKKADSGKESASSTNAEISGEKKTEETSVAEDPEILNFVDVFGKSYQVEINQNVKRHSYKLSAFVREGNKLTYADSEKYQYRLGIDVSEHQGQIDWDKVKVAGFDFAFIRVGYRGYGESGLLYQDLEFVKNIQNAQSAGVDVGVYFFSQAINEEESREEAQFVLQNIAGYDLQLPVVYDPESILDDVARTDDVTGEQFTANTEVFCKMIEDAGYKSMIYSNMLWEAYELDLEKLADYPIWYADYEPLPQTPYDFEFWQYTNEAQIDGIEGNTDLNIQLIRKELE